DRMNGTLLRRSPRSPKNQRTRFRPMLHRLEDRTLLTVAAFNLDPSVSSLALSGDLQGQQFQAQPPPSTCGLTTTYTGMVTVDYDFGAGTISFRGDGTSAAADVSGNCEPLPDGSRGLAPANYGGQVNYLGTARAAVRNFVATA